MTTVHSGMEVHVGFNKLDCLSHSDRKFPSVRAWTT